MEPGSPRLAQAPRVQCDNLSPKRWILAAGHFDKMRDAIRRHHQGRPASIFCYSSLCLAAATRTPWISDSLSCIEAALAGKNMLVFAGRACTYNGKFTLSTNDW